MRFITRHLLPIAVAVHLTALAAILAWNAPRRDADGAGDGSAPFVRADLDGRVLARRTPRITIELHLARGVASCPTIFITVGEGLDQHRERV